MGTRNIVITGLMGSGKSTIGKLVAQELAREFVDTDEFLVKHYGPASEILNQPSGDKKFSLVEEQVANTLGSLDNLVISTGGRFMLNQVNIDLMLANGKVFCLEADLNDIVGRLLNATCDTYRPRFERAENKHALMAQLSQQSAPYFDQFVKVQTSGRELSEITTEIVELFTQT